MRHLGQLGPSHHDAGKSIDQPFYLRTNLQDQDVQLKQPTKPKPNENAAGVWCDLLVTCRLVQCG